MTLKQMLVEMLNRKASDLHVRVGIRPHIRVNGTLEQIATDPTTIVDMDQVVSQERDGPGPLGGQTWPVSYKSLQAARNPRHRHQGRQHPSASF